MNFDKLEGKDFSFAYWCSGCNAEQATETIEISFDGDWEEIMIGPQCLTRLREQGKLEM